MNVKMIAVILFFLPSLSYALFCPTNFNQINIGDSIQQVQAQCGNPVSQETKKVTPEGPQEWNYFIPQTVMGAGAYDKTQGTLKTQINFDGDGKVININVNGIGVGATSECSQPIKLGDTRDQVKAACGKPSWINKSDPSMVGDTNQSQEQQSKEVTQMNYSSSNPPVQLIFENGLLKEVQ